jgi:Uma2 family endonuclease
MIRPNNIAASSLTVPGLIGKRIDIPPALKFPSDTIGKGGDALSTVRKEISPQEYLAIERQLETRNEYFRGEMFAMSGASYKHALIVGNLAREAGNQLKSGPCRVLTSDMRVKVTTTGLYTYPDMVIVCDQPRFEDSVFDTLLNPKVIIEVLSDSTEKYVRTTKFGHYRSIPSFGEYVLVAQDLPRVERFIRQEDESWNLMIFDEPSAVLAFGTIPVQIPFAEIYRNVEFDGSPERAKPTR